MPCFLSCLFLIIPVDYHINEVSRIEINHLYTSLGHHTIDQVILWDIDGHVQDYHILGNRAPTGEKDADGFIIIEPFDYKQITLISVRNYKYKYVIRNKGGYSFLIETISKLQETWTSHDPELDDREFLDSKDRHNKLKPFLNH